MKSDPSEMTHATEEKGLTTKLNTKGEIDLSPVLEREAHKLNSLYQEGHKAGYEVGHTQGYQAGFGAGYRKSHSKGFTNGYAKALERLAKESRLEERKEKSNDPTS